MRTGEFLGSASLKADAKQTLACGALSVALLIGLGLNYLFGFWQADPLIGLLISVFLVREGRQALREGKLCSCAACGLSASIPARTDGLELQVPKEEMPGFEDLISKLPGRGLKK